VLGEEILDKQGNRIARPLQAVTNVAALHEAGASSLVLLDRSQDRKQMTGIWHDQNGRYEAFTNGVTKPYWLVSDESAAVTERLESLLHQVELALPGILSLTNQLEQVLTGSADLTSNLNVVATTARPAVSNIILATQGLGQPGALGERLFPTNLNKQLETTLASADTALHSANTTLVTANTNLATLAENLNRSLENLASITANLNRQVEANTNLVKAVSDSIIHADQFIQGLKHHWLFRSAFKEKKPTSPAPPVEKLQSPKAGAQ
jgi:hypothetical protein